MRLWPAVLAASWLTLTHSPAWGQQRRAETARQYRLQWDDLPPLITGAGIALELPNGARIKGRVLSVEPEAMTIHVTKSSDRKLCDRGRQSVPRSAVSQFKISKRRGIAGRVIGTTIGLCFGLTTGFGLAAGAVLEGAYWGEVIAGILILPPTLGYFLGRQADHREMLIRLEPLSDRGGK